ncbi:hypothetical protein EDD21DRAFT_359812 [Dissophora ornata]|nr:hypothetical protein EDD21DRAFT_359812 [Dissophora ornata]
MIAIVTKQNNFSSAAGVVIMEWDMRSSGNQCPCDRTANVSEFKMSPLFGGVVIACSPKDHRQGLSFVRAQERAMRVLLELTLWLNATSTAADVAIDGIADGATTTTPFVVVIVAIAATVPVIIVDAALHVWGLLHDKG